CARSNYVGCFDVW
nr:immunoglobulin heavy chain junction region [Mus musculus]